MYVCLCKGITDRQIEAAVHDGADSLGKLRKTLGVASQCGKCSSLTREILDETLQSSSMLEIPMLAGMPQFYAVA
ncbi:bacterioferritin-associated ferredoxin [Gilvimarinus polysaccharolyticus]|uniref:bacterioferritin-associated ferredoxin n=1 Tax=Gilvimarinus polysaccharolyticus TaxID=863921 RepID=UPI0006732427|nr:bacterioferritin-associated ferredoxin [Gilvimarinus polysaccharolyticus]